MKDAILKTLAYFNYHNHPLTFAEVFRFLLAPGASPTADEVLKSLEILIAEGRVGEANGFYFLKGRQELVVARAKNYIHYLNRIFRAAKYIKVLKYVPYIRSIILSGSMSGMYGDAESDIDFFVITKPGRIWLARFFMAGATQILGVRRHGNKTVNRICLNHYLAEGRTPEIKYRPLDYATMLCLLNPEPAREMFLKQTWLKAHLAHEPELLSDSILTEPASKILQPLFEAILEVLGAGFWNKLAAKYQKKRIKISPGIRISDTELAFHPSGKWQKMMAEFNFKAES